MIDLLLMLGALFTLLAALGLLRLPDLFIRMHASTKPATLGASLVVAAVALHFRDVGASTQAILIVFFLFLTAPVAAHRIGRAAYFSGTRLWSGTVIDELRESYDASTHGLKSSEPAEARAEGPGAPQEAPRDEAE